MKRITLIILTLAFISSCGTQEMDQSSGSYNNVKSKSNEYTALESSSGNGYSGDGEYKKDVANKNKPKEEIQRKLIKTANLVAECEDYQRSITEIKNLVKNGGALIFSEDESQNNYQIENNITIKVPVQSFDVLVDSLEIHLPMLRNKTINSEDVTEEFFDLQTRIATKKEFEKQYLEILKKADSVEDLLKVQYDIRKIREEIEAAEGYLQVIQDRTSMSTITLRLFQELEQSQYVVSSPGFFTRIGKGLSSGWDGILDFIVGMTYVWPVWFFIALLIFIIKRKRIVTRLRKKLSV